MKKSYKREGVTKKFLNKLIVFALAITLCGTSTVHAQSSLYTTYVNELTDAVEIIGQQGWLESAFVTWNPVIGVSGYNVYYKESGETDEAYKQVDNQLIRQYGTYFRADILGLSQGNYVMKVVPVVNNQEDLSKQAVTSTVSVEAHTREGFAFSNESPMGTGSGGYNDDGSIPEEAQIIYISADTVNTIALDVITSSKGQITTGVGLVDILAKRQKGYDQRPLIIRMIGTIKDTDINGLNSSGYIQIKGSYNTTFEGIGEDATVYGWGFLIRDAHNIEIRNVGVMLFKDDGISLDTNNENIWIHHNDIFYGSAGGDSDQAKGDGSCDVKGFSTYVTVSYNHFWDSGKSSLCGMSDSQEFFVTYHHNWYDHSDSRHPRIRVGTVHIYNNYFDGNSKYGVGITKGGSAFVEANDFRNCKYPMLISLQGSDVANGNEGTFSNEPGGIIKAYNNQIEGAARLVYHQEDEKEFDAYLAQTREEQIPSTYQSVSGQNTYNNFDTSGTMYSYSPDHPEEVRNIVTTYAGRMNGGDFEWIFTEADDTDYGVNQGLMSAIRSYESELISIGGGSKDNPDIEDPDKENPDIEDPDKENPDIDEPDTDNPDTEEPGISQGSIVHNFTEGGKESNFFNIAGNLSTSKGSVTYNGLALTQCLKLESSTKIEFTTSYPATMTLVLEDTFSKNVVINGEKKGASNGRLIVELEAGTHMITKGDTANLFYILLEIEGGETGEDAPLPNSIDITSVISTDNNTFNISWTPISSVDYYEVSYKMTSDEIFIVPEKGNRVQETSFSISGLTLGESYDIKVAAFRGGDSTFGIISKKLEQSTPIEKQWYVANIGTGAAGTVKVNSDNTVTIYATNGKMADSEDGFTYYYTEIDPYTENFTLTATFTIDDAQNIDNQSGFGIIAIDTLGDKSKEDKYFNSAGAIITKYNQVIDDVTISEYGLPGGRFITGYTLAPSEPDPNWGTRKNIDTAPFDWNYRADEFEEKVPRYKTGDTYTLTLRKSNTGFHASMEGQAQEVVCYEPELLLKQEKDKYYVGFFASRYIKATISDIKFTTVNPSMDEVKIERPIKYFDASLSYDATLTSSSSKYEAAFKSNVMGTLTIKDVEGTIIVSDRAIKNKDRNLIPLNLKEDTNTYIAIFTPSSRENQQFTPYEELNSYAPITFPFTITQKKYGTSENAIYVSPNGSQNGEGTKAAPLDLNTAIAYVQPGQQIVLLDGLYELNQSIIINRGNSGTKEKPIVIMSSPEERAILDFTNASGTGITLKGDYWHFYNLEIRHANKSGIRIHGNNNILEKLEIHDNKDTGLQISGFSTETSAMWPAHNLVLSCESYNNCDRLGNDADGFAAKLTVGEGNVFRYCISHHNIDDGWDLYAKSTTGPIGEVLIEKCVTYANGKTTYSDQTGEGNGFKLGGESMPGKHVLKDSISFNNIAKGITSNSGPDCQIYNSISYANGAENVSLYTYVKETDYVIQNVIGYKQGKSDKYAFGITQAREWKNDGTVFINGSNGTTQVSDFWFTSLNTTTVPTIVEDGSINLNGLLQLTDNAPFVGPVFGANPTPTVIEIGKEIEKEQPVVTFEWDYIGETTITIEQGNAFRVPVVRANNNTGQEVKVTVMIQDSSKKVLDSIDTTVVGNYTITYNAMDVSGNQAEMIIIVIVKASEEESEPEEVLDTEAPVFRYEGKDTIKVANGQSFTVPQVKAFDLVDGEVAVELKITNSKGEALEQVDTTIAETYILTYQAVDHAGNSSTLVILVKVEEKAIEGPSEDDQSVPAGGGGNSGTIVVPSIAELVAASLRENKDPVIDANKEGRVNIPNSVLQQIAESGKQLIIKVNDTIHLNLNWQILKEQGNNNIDIKVVQPVQDELKKLTAAIQAYKNLDLVNGKQFTIAVDISSNETGLSFNEPMSIIFDLSKEEIKDASKLTAVRYELQEDGTIKVIKVGGKYNVSTGQFEFLVDRTGTFGLVEAEKLIKVDLTVNVKEAIVNGKIISNDVAPKIVNSRTMLPVRFIAESLGAKVGYKNGYVTITLDNQTIRFKVGEMLEAYNIKPFIEESRTYISVRWVAEAFDAHVLWIPSSRKIEIVR